MTTEPAPDRPSRRIYMRPEKGDSLESFARRAYPVIAELLEEAGQVEKAEEFPQAGAEEPGD